VTRGDDALARSGVHTSASWHVLDVTGTARAGRCAPLLGQQLAQAGAVECGESPRHGVIGWRGVERRMAWGVP
jgi:hypothetical protein